MFKFILSLCVMFDFIEAEVTQCGLTNVADKTIEGE